MSKLSGVAARTALRLLASSEMSHGAMILGTVQFHLKQSGVKSEFPDEAQNSLIVQGTMSQVLMGLSSLGWTHGPEEPVAGGMYCSGTAVTVEGPQRVRVMQTQIERVTIWIADPELPELPGQAQ